MAPDAGALRATEALFSSNGAFTVTLRLPGLAVSGSDAEQLGLSTPVFQEIPVGPAVWRKPGSSSELLISSAPIHALLGTCVVAAAEVVLQQACGVIVDGVLYAIERAEPLTRGGMPCAYRLALQAPVWS